MSPEMIESGCFSDNQADLPFVTRRGGGEERSGSAVQETTRKSLWYRLYPEAWRYRVDLDVERLARQGDALNRELKQLLKSASAEARLFAARVFAYRSEISAELAPELAQATFDSDPQVRRAAAEALGGLDSATEVTIRALETALRDASWQVRYAAATSLAQLGPKARGASPALAKAVNDPDRLVKRKAIEALAALGSNESFVIETLRSASSEDRPESGFAKRALERLISDFSIHA